MDTVLENFYGIPDGRDTFEMTPNVEVSGSVKTVTEQFEVRPVTQPPSPIVIEAEAVLAIAKVLADFDSIGRARVLGIIDAIAFPAESGPPLTEYEQSERNLDALRDASLEGDPDF